MQRQQVHQSHHCANAQPMARACVSVQDSATAAALNCRASNASTHPPLPSVIDSESYPVFRHLQCESKQSDPSHSTADAGQSAFYKCSTADQPPALTSPASQAPSGQSLGVVGQAMIVSSRVPGYCRAVWGLLVQCADEHDEGACLDQHADSGSSGTSPSTPPLLKFLSAVRLLVQHLILLRLQALHISAASNEADARSLLQHVLLWQYLRHNSVMELITLAMHQGAGSPPASGRGSNAAHGSFLMCTGVPLVQQAIAQVHGSLTLCTASDGSTAGTEVVLDMMAVLTMLHTCSVSAPEQSSDYNIDALSQDVQSLQRAVSFISSNTAFVAYLLSASQGSKQGAPMCPQKTFATLAYASALLGSTTHASVKYLEVQPLATARAAVSRYSASAAQLYRGAKAAILDARIQTTCDSSASTAVARAQISTAVNKAFRKMYLFPELKHLLCMWSGMLGGVVNDGLLPVNAVLGAEAAAAAAFDTEGECLRFRVPSSGFLLIWSTCPHSPACTLLTTPKDSPRAPASRLSPAAGGWKRSAADMRGSCSPPFVSMKRSCSENPSGTLPQIPRRAANSDSVLIEFGHSPCRNLDSAPTQIASGDSGSNGSNGSDSTNMAGACPGIDSSGCGSAGAAGAAAGAGMKGGTAVFAVPPPRPARRLCARTHTSASVSLQACVHPPVCQQMSVSAHPPAALRVTETAQPRPLQTAFGMHPGSLAASAAPPFLR